MSNDPRFIHLRVHTEYSLLQGAVHAKKLPEMAAHMDMPAVAVTDTNNMFCALEFSEGAAKAGVQPIIGCQVDVGYTTPTRETPRRPCALLCCWRSPKRVYEPDEAELVHLSAPRRR